MDTLDPWPPGDPLGEALHFMLMNGAFYCRSQLTSPWGLELPPMPGYLWLHVLISGRCWLEAAFGRAFKRIIGVAPGGIRRDAASSNNGHR
jgi:hypothetical protein